MPKVLIATPTADTIEPKTAAWREAIAHRYRDRITFADLVDLPVVAVGRPVDYVRNNFVRLFLSTDCTHLFLLDSDTEPPLDAIEKLLALNVLLASGCYPVLMKNGLRWALANRDAARHYRLLEWLESTEKPFEVDAGGAGCLLIRRDVFDLVKWPYFKWVEYEDGTQESEDIYFFRKCNDAGLRVTVEPSVICSHYKKLNLTPFMIMMLIKKHRENKKC